jgi:hypothetical protein
VQALLKLKGKMRVEAAAARAEAQAREVEEEVATPRAGFENGGQGDPGSGGKPTPGARGVADLGFGGEESKLDMRRFVRRAFNVPVSREVSVEGGTPLREPKGCSPSPSLGLGFFVSYSNKPWWKSIITYCQGGSFPIWWQQWQVDDFLGHECAIKPPLPAQQGSLTPGYAD